MARDRLLRATILASIFMFNFSITIDARSEIIIGCTIPLSGRFERMGESFRNGIELGVEEINNSGGILGDKIKMVLTDSQGEPNIAVSNVNKLISFEKADIIYTFFSSETLAALKISTGPDIPHVTTVAKKCRLTMSGYSNILRFVELDEIKYSALIRYFRLTKAPQTIAVFMREREAEKPLSEYIVAQTKIMRIEPVPLAYAKVGELVRSLKQTMADAVVILSPGSPDSQVLLKTIADYDISIPILTVGFVASGPGNGDTFLFDMLKKHGKRFPTTYIETDFDRDANRKAVEFYENYRKKFGKLPDSVGARAYDSIFYIAEVIKSAGKRIKRFNEEASKLEWFEGVTGTIKVLDNGDIVKEANIIQVWHGSERELRFGRGPKPKPHPIR